MEPALLALLRSVDTPTVCYAIEVAQGKRGVNSFTRGTMLVSAPNDAPTVGFAVTAQIAALVPPIEDTATIRNRRIDYYRAMAEGPNPRWQLLRIWIILSASVRIGARSTPQSIRGLACRGR